MRTPGRGNSGLRTLGRSASAGPNRSRRKAWLAALFLLPLSTTIALPLVLWRNYHMMRARHGEGLEVFAAAVAKESDARSGQQAQATQREEGTGVATGVQMWHGAQWPRAPRSLAEVQRLIDGGATADGAELPLPFCPHELLGPQREPAQVWLYGQASADDDMAPQLLPHWLHHYASWGIPPSTTVVSVHVNASDARAAEAAHLLAAQLQQAGALALWWHGRYSAARALRVQLRALWELVPSPHDWVVVSDLDELHEYGHYASVQAFLAHAAATRANWVQGVLVDRVAAGGTLAPIMPQPELFSQFPFNCRVVRDVVAGNPIKVAAFKAHWRVGSGSHCLVQPRDAARYFGAASQGGNSDEEDGSADVYPLADAYPLTPYHLLSACYLQPARSGAAAGQWSAARYDAVADIYHFKWHAGVVEAAQRLGATLQGDADSPKLRQATAIVSVIGSMGAVPFEAAGCLLDEHVNSGSGRAGDSVRRFVDPGPYLPPNWTDKGWLNSASDPTRRL